ncbi:hypothetical protein WN55_07956 [Dufourea novaeangliae]|uniref:Histone-lysine N-methyltransferase SETMAR n=1 Tax=Dufourea novaeangliae TaxID=178035 RepID=A0A154P668_DUFNO|nr:hypothetical protein WN55_07956 [Dufourea novaeangliae]
MLFWELDVQRFHDNAQPHCTKLTREQLEKLGWSTVHHPPCSSNIAPSTSLTIIPPSERYIRDFFASQPRSFWENGIQNLSNR